MYFQPCFLKTLNQSTEISQVRAQEDLGIPTGRLLHKSWILFFVNGSKKKKNNSNHKTKQQTKQNPHEVEKKRKKRKRERRKSASKKDSHLVTSKIPHT